MWKDTELCMREMSKGVQESIEAVETHAETLRTVNDTQFYHSIGKLPLKECNIYHNCAF